MKQARILFAHGSRDAHWARPFEALRAHLKRDLPALVAEAGARHPELAISLEPALGEQPEVIAALAAAIGRG